MSTSKVFPDGVAVMFAFCPTGEGGGVDNSCSSASGGSSSGSGDSSHASGSHEEHATLVHAAKMASLDGFPEAAAMLMKQADAVKPAVTPAAPAPKPAVAQGPVSQHATQVSAKASLLKQLQDQKNSVLLEVQEAKKAGDQTKVNGLYQKSSKLNKMIAKAKEEHKALIDHQEKVEKPITDLVTQKNSILAQIAEIKATHAGKEMPKDQQSKIDGLYQKSSKINKQLKAIKAGQTAGVAPSMITAPKPLTMTTTKLVQDEQLSLAKSIIATHVSSMKAEHATLQAAGETVKANAKAKEIVALETAGTGALKGQIEHMQMAATLAKQKGDEAGFASASATVADLKNAQKIFLEQKKVAQSATQKLYNSSSISQALEHAPEVEVSCCIDPAVVTGDHFKSLLSKNYEGEFEKMEPAVQKVAKAYTGSAYFGWNKQLRDAKGDDDKLPDDLRAKFANFDKAFEQAPRVAQDVIVERGFTAKVVDHLKTGDVFVDHGYMSTSTNGGIARSFSGGVNLLRIKVPAGAKALYAGGFSHYKNERELVLPRGTRLRVEGVKLEKGFKGKQLRVLQVVVEHEHAGGMADEKKGAA